MATSDLFVTHTYIHLYTCVLGPLGPHNHCCFPRPAVATLPGASSHLWGQCW